MTDTATKMIEGDGLIQGLVYELFLAASELKNSLHGIAYVHFFVKCSKGNKNGECVSRNLFLQCPNIYYSTISVSNFG